MRKFKTLCLAGAAGLAVASAAFSWLCGRSGCHFSASLRYARLSSSAVHDGDTPSKTYGSSGVDVDARARREIRGPSSL